MAQPDPNAPPETIAFSGFSGMKNTVTAERLTADELVRALNVDIDDKGQLLRRRGKTLVAGGDFHSLFAANDGTVYGVRNNNLCIINPDYSTEVLKTGLNSDPATGLSPLCYLQIGETIYFSSLQDSGKIIGDVVKPWGQQNDAGLWLSPVIHPTPTLAAIRGKLLKAPPMATAMTYWNGRIYMANGRQLWATELYLYDYVDATRTFFTFETDITLLGTVGDGFYVGGLDGLWFMSGPRLDGLKRQKVMDSAVIPGSSVDVPAELANPPQIPATSDTPTQVSICFLTENGFCVAQDSGQAYNLTEAKFIFPGIQRAAAMFRRQDGVSQYLAVGDSGGTPTAAARIGDFADAEIIRGGGRWSLVVDQVTFGDAVDATVI